MSHEIVERFGQLVMRQRDTVIRHFEHAVEGTDPAIRHQNRHRDLVLLTDEQRAIVRREVIEAIDGAIHHLLWFFEQHDVNGFDVMFVGTDDDPVLQPVSVSDLSDGTKMSCPGSSTVSGTSQANLRSVRRLEHVRLRSMSGGGFRARAVSSSDS